MSRHVTDFKKTPFAIVLDLINHDNKTSLTDAKVDISSPVLGESKRVSITVSSKIGSGYRGTQVLHYNRVPLAELTAHEEVQSTVIHDVITLNEIVDLFNIKYGVNLTAEDITIDGLSIDGVTPWEQPQGPVKSFVIAAKDTSLVWHGSTIFKLRSNAQLLSDVILTTALDGLCLPGTWYLPPDQSIRTDGNHGIRADEEGSVLVFA